MASHQEYMLTHADEVSEVIEGWLSAEVTEADQGRNGYMSEFPDGEEPTSLFVAQMPTLLAKATSHRDRFGHFIDTLVGNPQEDAAFARVAFASLMFASGGRRWETLLIAENVADYRRIRETGEGVGVNVAEIVNIAYQTDPGSGATLKAEAMGLFSDYARHTSTTIYGLAQNAAAIALEKPRDAVTEAVNLQRDAQMYGVMMAARTISLAAEFRDGSLESVPLLEPKSITDAELYYPFRPAA